MNGYTSKKNNRVERELQHPSARWKLFKKVQSMIA